MKQRSRLSRARCIVCIGFIFSALMLVGCNSMSQSTSATTQQNNGGSAQNAKGCNKIGVLLPDTISSTRWEAQDHPILESTLKSMIPGVQVDFSNAQGNSDTQTQQAQTDLNNGDCILVVAPHDSIAAADIVAAAKAHNNVPVIAYDRLIQSKDTSYFVSFDGVAVGKLQGQYIANHYPKDAGTAANVVMINGSQTDVNALLFSQGVHEVLDPLFANKSMIERSEVYTPDWSNIEARSEMSAALSQNKNNVQVAYVANDGMASYVIKALHDVGLDRSVVVTGQDATTEGIHNILAGTQSMTVYKPVKDEAQAVAQLVKALYDGTDTKSLTGNNTTTTNDGSKIPSILAQPTTVDINNIKSTVLADKVVSVQDICKGIPAGTAGIC